MESSNVGRKDAPARQRSGRGAVRGMTSAAVRPIGRTASPCAATITAPPRRVVDRFCSEICVVRRRRAPVPRCGMYGRGGLARHRGVTRKTDTRRLQRDACSAGSSCGMQGGEAASAPFVASGLKSLPQWRCIGCVGRSRCTVRCHAGRVVFATTAHRCDRQIGSTDPRTPCSVWSLHCGRGFSPDALCRTCLGIIPRCGEDRRKHTRLYVISEASAAEGRESRRLFVRRVGTEVPPTVAVHLLRRVQQMYRLVSGRSGDVQRLHADAIGSANPRMPRSVWPLHCGRGFSPDALCRTCLGIIP